VGTISVSEPVAPAGAVDASRTPLLKLTGVEKRYGGVRALRGADLTIRSTGVVHGLLGENGSGKSTLLGILSGQVRPDHGQILVDGESVSFAAPADALARGIAMVSQETAVAPSLSVTENILLGPRLVRNATGIDWRASRRRAAEVLNRLGLDYDLDVPVARLRPDQRQMIEIARALSMDARILILDEPTSSLTDDEVASLFGALAHLKEADVSTIFVSHRLGEILSLCDEVTVLRDGRDVASGPVSGYDANSLVEAMVGSAREIGRRSARRSATDERLCVTGLSAPGLSNIDLDVRAGEIVGLAGLVGAGRSELLEAIFGTRPRTGGELRIDGEPLVAGEPRAAIKHGIGYLPPDRKVQGLVLGMSVAENLTMVSTSGRSRLRVPGRRRELETVAEFSRRMRIQAADPGVPVGTLSGGNQQKVALAKWLVREPRLLLLDEPTRGVDVGSKMEIHQLLREVADRGIGLLVSSSENDELLTLSDRIVVMFRGRVVASLDSDEADEAALARLAGGQIQG
jgi:ABC-type sugar transport system ATPase subunit